MRRCARSCKKIFFHKKTFFYFHHKRPTRQFRDKLVFNDKHGLRYQVQCCKHLGLTSKFAMESDEVVDAIREDMIAKLP